MNRDLIRLHVEAAQRAISGARYNLDGDYFGIAVNRAYYAFFYAASGLLLMQGIERSKHSGVLSEFNRLFVKTRIFPTTDGQIYAEAFERRNVVDYEMLGHADDMIAIRIVEVASEFVEKCEAYLRGEDIL